MKLHRRVRGMPLFAAPRLRRFPFAGGIAKTRTRLKLKRNLLRTLASVIVMGMAPAASVAQSPQQTDLTNTDLTSTSAFVDGVQAYIYGYPLLMMGLTERVATTVPGTKPNLGRAPLNQFAKETTLPNGSYKDVVLPSTSTIYASAFLSLNTEQDGQPKPRPIVLHIPDIDRFYLMQMLDAWTNVSLDSPGTRQGSQPGDYLLVGPDWNGTLPAGMTKIQMPTNTMWIIGRIFTSGTESDLNHIANDIVPNLTLTPLSEFGKDFTPPDNLPVDPSIDTVTTPLHQVANMDACTFFGTLAAMMKTNSPLPADQRIVDPSGCDSHCSRRAFRLQ